MNKVIDTSTRLFLAIVGPSGSGKTELIFKLLKGKHFIPNFKEPYSFTKRFRLFIAKNRIPTALI